MANSPIGIGNPQRRSNRDYEANPVTSTIASLAGKLCREAPI